MCPSGPEVRILFLKRLFVVLTVKINTTARFSLQGSSSPEPSEAAGGGTRREEEEEWGSQRWRWWGTLLFLICWRHAVCAENKRSLTWTFLSSQECFFFLFSTLERLTGRLTKEQKHIQSTFCVRCKNIQYSRCRGRHWPLLLSAVTAVSYVLVAHLTSLQRNN